MTEQQVSVDRTGPVEELGRLQAVLERVPASIAVLEGPTHRFTLANSGYRELVGGRDVVGLRVEEALPEVVEQGFIDLLDRVFATGERYLGSETPVVLDRDGGRVEVFLNFAYLPMRGASGEVEGILVHAVDVTELVAARRAVEESAEQLAVERRRLETLIEQMPAGVVIAEVPGGRLAAANERFRSFFPVPVDVVGAIEGYAAFSARRPDGTTYEPAEYPLARAVTDGEVVTGEQMTIRRADGTYRTIEVSAAPVVREGRREAGIATFFDVTEERRNAVLVAGNKDVLERVAAGAPLEDALVSLVRMIERQADEPLLASVLLLDGDGVHLRHGAAPSLPDAYNEAIDGIEIGPGVGSCGTAAFRREPVVVTDIATDPLWVDFRELALGHDLRACWSTPILSAAGEVLGTFALYYREPHVPTDDERALVALATQTAAIAIERKRLEAEREQLLAAERAARAAAEQRANAALSLEHVNDGVCLVDDEGVVRVWNPAAATITGVCPAEVVGHRLAEALPGFAAVVAGLPPVQPGAAGREVPALPVSVAGRELWLGLAATPFDGGVVHTFRDRTADRRLEQMRAEIVATVSHELRTPLAAVFGAAQTLTRPEVQSAPPLRDRFLEMISGETQRLTRVVDQILRASEIDEETEEPPLEAVDVAAVVGRVVELGRGAASGVELSLTCSDALPAARAHRERLQQVAANLVDNAFKYGAEGGRIDVTLAQHAGKVRLAVADHGRGVPRTESERIFDRFYRLDPDQRQGVPGTGLGLYICREYVGEMDGEIWVEETDGGGATFVVELQTA